MNDILNQLQDAIEFNQMEHYRVLKKIKVTHAFYNMLRSACGRSVIYDMTPPLTTCFGIPVEIDDTIENDYELVY